MDHFLGAKYFAIAVPSITDETGLKSFSALVIFITVLPGVGRIRYQNPHFGNAVTNFGNAVTKIVW
jgi:hypothetical protein